MSRELEHKYVVEGATQLEVEEAVQSLFARTSRSAGQDTDTYWKAPNVDFVRLRKDDDGHGELTVKLSDKGTNKDRLEINLYLGQNYRKAYDQQVLLYGQPLGCITKVFFKLESITGAEISVYTVANDPQRRIILEIEAPDLPTINQAFKTLYEKAAFKLIPEPRSNFQLFIRKGS